MRMTAIIGGLAVVSMAGCATRPLSGPEARAPAARPDAVLIDSEGRLSRIYELPNGRRVTIRPDGELEVETPAR